MLVRAAEQKIKRNVTDETQKLSTRYIYSIQKSAPRVSRGKRDAGVICGGDLAS